MREVRVFDEQSHSYFTQSLDFVLMESLLHALGQTENARKTRFHHDWEAWEVNNLMGFAPVYKRNTLWGFDADERSTFNFLN